MTRSEIIKVFRKFWADAARIFMRNRNALNNCQFHFKCLARDTKFRAKVAHDEVDSITLNVLYMCCDEYDTTEYLRSVVSIVFARCMGLGKDAAHMCAEALHSFRGARFRLNYQVSQSHDKVRELYKLAHEAAKIVCRNPKAQELVDHHRLHGNGDAFEFDWRNDHLTPEDCYV